ncbi:alpha/beta hydrolase [Nocardia bovistercoris]|uniref:Esterase family protein n=1 Tax=Nocardia bovistercoris TaxID=2785916 RepID=A0A931N274_9NOCA|nr:alpha/beta hydrolase family protein [Nocardia bovistercoris]MBH0779195.1 esterase family protein [Nocardia bovistercoris]
MSKRVPIAAAAMAAVAATTLCIGGRSMAEPPAAEPPNPMAPSTPPPPVDPKMTRTGLLSSETIAPQHERLRIASAAMRRVVEVDVLRGAGDGPRPTLYLLDGVDGEPTSGWLTKGNAARFFADKPVDVVLTAGGTGSMYSDWDRHDAALGLNRWETFLTDELPPIVESLLKSNGARAIAGVSMGAQAAMMLTQRHPGLYRAVAGMSGCYSTADPLGQAITTITVASRGGNVNNLWGPPTSPEWAEHDTVLGADKLRGTAVYLSAASGAPTHADLSAVARATDVMAALGLVGGGAALEAGARSCTERFAARLAELRIPVTVDYSDAGMHTWVDFEAQLPRAWNVLAEALGVPRPQ